MSYNPEYYIHDLDRKAFDALNKFPAIVRLQEEYLANVEEKIAKMQYLSTGVLLGKNQMPEIYGLVAPICKKLGIHYPDVYMIQSTGKDDINAFTGGIREPFICLTSEMIKQLPLNMISSAIAHECGHIACKHYLYHSLARNLINGIEKSPLNNYPTIQKHLSKSLVAALLFWDRCSELSADRAAVLCDGNADTFIDTLLRLNGYDESVNREAFVEQAVDLHLFVNESETNKMIEQLIARWNTHPFLASRVYECSSFSKSDQFKAIINDTYSGMDPEINLSSTTVIESEVELKGASSGTFGKEEVPPEVQIALQHRLNELDVEIERYTCRAEKEDYAYAVGCGIISGAIDSGFFSDLSIFGDDIGLSHKAVNQFIQRYADFQGIGDDRLKNAIANLETEFKVLQDNVWKGNIAGVNAKNHHLADLAHHPTPFGLLASLAVQFMRIGTFVSKDGDWHFVFLKPNKDEIIDLAIPAVITGILNWLVYISEEKYEEKTERKTPRSIHRLAHLIASTPEIIQIVECANNWFGHLVSDMGGSKNTAGGGMGIPGVFLSLFHEIASLPVINETGLPEVVNNIYVKGGIDLREEIAYSKQLKLQAIPVMFNEIAVRTGFLVTRLITELVRNKSFKGVQWQNVIPFNNRTLDRMLAVSSMTFNFVDTGDAAVRAAIESGGDWIIFSGKFVARYNFVGAGRAALAIVKEVSNESKEAQLIHEKMLLMEAKSQMMFQQLQKFKHELEEKLTNYLAEDISAFIEGFDYINAGIESNNSNLVIKGNVIIQKVLGRAPQFSTQKEFDELMESDIPLIL